MNALEIAGVLRCPLCAGALSVAERALRCPDGHSFDVARNGAVTLARGGGLPEGDAPEMLAARERFLSRGHYSPIADAVTSAMGTGARVVVDCGAGTGWYLARVLEALPDATGVALDVSAAATKLAARSHERAVAVRADVWAALPVADGAVDVLLVVFSPRNGPEFARVLAPNGRAITVTPTTRHLLELRDELGLLSVPEDKRERLHRAMAPLAPVTVEEVEFPLVLDGSAVRDLVAMGPNARHGMRAADEPRMATASVEITTFAAG